MSSAVLALYFIDVGIFFILRKLSLEQGHFNFSAKQICCSRIASVR